MRILYEKLDGPWRRHMEAALTALPADVTAEEWDQASPEAARLAAEADAVMICGNVASRHVCLAASTKESAALICVEPGWFTPQDTVQLGLGAVGLMADWSEPTRGACESGGLTSFHNCGHLLLVAQNDDDHMLQHFSPFYRDTGDLAEFMMHVTYFPIATWVPPDVKLSNKVHHHLRALGIPILEGDAVEEADRAVAVATINSNWAAVAVARHRPVMCFGAAAYRQQGVVFTLGDNPDETQVAMKEVRRKRCDVLSIHLQRRFVEDARKHQCDLKNMGWRIDQILAKIRRSTIAS